MFVLGHTPSFFVLLCLASLFGFSGTHLNLFPVLTWTSFRYSPEPFFGTRTDPFPVLAWTLFRYSPGPFSNTHPNSTPFSVLAWILLRYLLEPFSDTHLDSTPFRYSSRYDLFSGTRLDTILFVLDSPILARILSLIYLVFSGTRSNMISSLVLAQIRSLLQHRARISLGSPVLAQT